MSEPLIEIASGRLGGERRTNGLVFRGIPYGADTGGPHRFLPPQPVAPWSDIRDATHFGPRAPQPHRPHAPGFEWLDSHTPQAEDCLVLNVYTPATEGRRPVMVWLHGGAFAFGAGDLPVHDGTALAARGDVVVVTLNHRLNVLGFLAPLGESPRFADSGNAGMLDLVAALQWVHDHITAFGGDPGNVTIFGQSGGGAKVAVLMAMQAAQGLFHRAIIQSPSSGFTVQEPEGPQRFAQALLKTLDLTPVRVAELQRVDLAALQNAMARVIAAEGGEDQFRPMIDGRSLRGQPFFPHAPEIARTVPLMLGYAATEASFYLAPDPSRQTLDAARLHARVKRFLKLDDADTATLLRDYAAIYPGQTPAELLVHVAGDHMYRLTTMDGATQKAHQGGAPVFLYRFQWRTPLDPFLKSPHTAELPFVFGQFDAARRYLGDSPDVPVLMHRMMDTWVRFARTGSPNGEDLPPWPAFDPATAATMCFDASECRVQADPEGAALAVMRRYRRFVPGTALNYRAD